MGNKACNNPAISILLVLASILFTLILLEIAARTWIGMRWTDDEIARLTTVEHARLGYASDAYTGYRPEPGYYRKDNQNREFTHNDLGFRGHPFNAKKADNQFRVVLMGASTIYGPNVDDSETSAAQLEVLLRKAHPDRNIVVINAGVPGWTSRETVINLKRNILALTPDVILVMDGRNEIFPQLFNNYRDDYSHFRDLAFHFPTANRKYRTLFKYSRLAMLIVAGRGAKDGRFGYSHRAGNPVYGYNVWENQPNTNDIAVNAHTGYITRGFQNNLEAIVRITVNNNIKLVLASIPFYAENYRSGVIPGIPVIRAELKYLVAQNNAVTRETAQSHSLPFVDGASLSLPDFLVDDCHFTSYGEGRVAKLMADAILPLMPEGRLSR